MSPDMDRMDDANLDSEAAIRWLQEQARYVFDLDEFAALTGRMDNLASARASLSRLVERKRVLDIQKRPSVYVIVTAEYSHYGAPPVNWWLHDYVSRSFPDYYLGLLSAARHWGSSHYALQVTQVMIPGKRPDVTVGRQTVLFFTKTDIKTTPVIEVPGEKAVLRVSTREATLLDLMRHQAKVGGIEAVARVANDFSADLSASGMLAALDATGQMSVAQRLGFLFDRLHNEPMAELLEKWLSPRRPLRRPLSEGAEWGDIPEYDPRWSIRYSNDQLNVLDEIR